MWKDKHDEILKAMVVQVRPPRPVLPSYIRTREREFFIDNLLVRIHFIIEMIWWTGLAPREFEFLFPGSLTATFQAAQLLLLTL